MMDLERLGAALRERREALGIPRAAVARRVGVTPTYIWLIEGTRPRKGGKPSRPAQAVLERWTAALGMDERYTRQALVLAGYLPSPIPPAEPARDTTMPMPAYAPASPPAPPAVHRGIMAQAASTFQTRPALDRLESFAAAPIQFEQPRDLRTEVLVEQLRDVLRLAEGTPRWEDTAQLAESLLEWLRFRVEQGGSGSPLPR
jgi:transcriptional regulator with XRE-family HTH domain